jgi:hypothetical protein
MSSSSDATLTPCSAACSSASAFARHVATCDMRAHAFGDHCRWLRRRVGPAATFRPPLSSISRCLAPSLRRHPSPAAAIGCVQCRRFLRHLRRIAMQLVAHRRLRNAVSTGCLDYPHFLYRPQDLFPLWWCVVSSPPSPPSLPWFFCLAGIFVLLRRARAHPQIVRVSGLTYKSPPMNPAERM